MIDHDALSRRIAYELSMAAYVDPSGWTVTEVASLIAKHLREALPTSEETSLTPEQVERARRIVYQSRLGSNVERSAIELLREVAGDE